MTIFRKSQQNIKEKRLIGTVDILKSMNIPEQEIIRQVGSLYEMDEEEMQKYLRGNSKDSEDMINDR